MEIKFYTQYNKPPRVVAVSGDHSLTDASCLKDTDINTILRKYNAGDLSVVRPVGSFGDVSNIGDFADCMERVRMAREEFDALPAAIRERFGYDPAQMVSFLEDSKNDDEAVKLGLKVRFEQEKTLTEQIVEGVTAGIAAKPVPSTASVAS